ncbi:hypothetical protein [Neorhizobium sp. DAR64860/K0K1]|uniref:hypothetical protein n=1 Tax=Neorhizobium sp. DAR64860/K0K1 TaxID=3421955 RepID=UPI003D29BE64
MQEIHTSQTGEDARVSRRKFFTIAAAGYAATLPAVAIAKVSGRVGRLPQSLESQYQECAARLREILTQMHPNVSKVHLNLNKRDDGSFRFCVQGDVTFQPFQGDGIYIVSIDGWPSEYLVREKRIITLSGRDLGYSHYYGQARAEDGGWDDHERFVSNFVSKVGEVPA